MKINLAMTVKYLDAVVMSTIKKEINSSLFSEGVG